MTIQTEAIEQHFHAVQLIIMYEISVILTVNSYFSTSEVPSPRKVCKFALYCCTHTVSMSTPFVYAHSCLKYSSSSSLVDFGIL